MRLHVIKLREVGPTPTSGPPPILSLSRPLNAPPVIRQALPPPVSAPVPGHHGPASKSKTIPESGPCRGAAQGQSRAPRTTSLTFPLVCTATLTLVANTIFFGLLGRNLSPKSAHAVVAANVAEAEADHVVSRDGTNLVNQPPQLPDLEAARLDCNEQATLGEQTDCHPERTSSPPILIALGPHAESPSAQFRTPHQELAVPSGDVRRDAGIDPSTKIDSSVAVVESELETGAEPVVGLVQALGEAAVISEVAPRSLNAPDVAGPPKGAEPVDFESFRDLGTAVQWCASPAEAAKLAVTEQKLIFLLLVSGNFARQEFT